MPAFVFQNVTSLCDFFSFFSLLLTSTLMVRFAHMLHPSRDGTFPELVPDSKEQLLFHGCVQAESGQLHWVAGLLAVFVTSSKKETVYDEDVCTIPQIGNNWPFKASQT